MSDLPIFLNGMLAAMIMGLLMVVLEVVKISSFNFMLLVGEFFIRQSKDKALAASLGWLIHLFLGGMLAEVYFWLVAQGIFFAEFSLITALLWSAFLWLVTMLVVMPVLNAGLFAVKLGKLKWLEFLTLFFAYGHSLNYLILALLV